MAQLWSRGSLAARAAGRLVLVAVVTLLAGLHPESASALPNVIKRPTGEHVTAVGGSFQVPAGQDVDWVIEVCNDSGGPIDVAILDEVHGGECSPDEYLTLVCPPLNAAGGAVDACDDAGFGALDISGIPVANNDCVEVSFRTTVDLLTPPGTLVGNVAFFFTSLPGESGQTFPPGAPAAGCTRVEVLAPIPTELKLDLTATRDAPPFVGGNPASTAVLRVAGTNMTPRPAEGTLSVPLPPGTDFVETIACPPGATCEAMGGAFVVSDLVVARDGAFEAAFRVAAGCDSLGLPQACSQGTFTPAEDPANLILTDGDAIQPGEQESCFAVVSESLSPLNKTVELVDLDGDGLPSVGDRVRYVITAWNSGQAVADDVRIEDALPLGLDADSVTVDARGTYDPGPPGLATWELGDMGPGTAVELFLEASVVAPVGGCNRARASTAVTRACGLPDIGSDNPATPIAGDATCAFTPAQAPRITKELSFDDVDGDGLLDPGEPVSFRIEIWNDGTEPIVGGALSDALDACWDDATGVTLDPPDGGTDASTPREVIVNDLGGMDGLWPGELVVVTFDTATATPESCCNQASLAPAGAGGPMLGSDDPVTALVAGDTTCAVPAGAVPELTKALFPADENGDGLPQVGESVSVRLTLANRGEDFLVGGVVTDELPPGLEVDPGSVITIPAGIPVSFVPAPGGFHGGGRLEFRDLLVGPGGVVTLTFQATLADAAVGMLCNEATLVAPGLLAPFRSHDAATGAGPSCLDVTQPPRPVLVLAASSSGDLFDACALPGEQGTVVLDFEVQGDAEAAAAQLELAIGGGWLVVDPGDGVVGPDGVRWDLGDVPLGTIDSRSVLLEVPCAAEAGLVLTAEASFDADLAAMPAAAMLAPLTTAVPVLEGAIDLVHDDGDGDGEVDAGELLAATVTVTETGGCDAVDAAVVLTVDPNLAVTAVLDGGIDGGGTVSWTGPGSPPLALVPTGGAASVRVDLTLADAAENCSLPVLAVEGTWPRSPGTACPESGAWARPGVATPPGHCDTAEPPALLREPRVSRLLPVTPALSSVLDAAGQHDSCLGGVTRLDPNPPNVWEPDVRGLLAAGIVVPDDALSVGEGNPGVVIFYEVSHSCAVIRACKVDADGDPANGAESVRISSTPCGG